MIKFFLRELCCGFADVCKEHDSSRSIICERRVVGVTEKE